MVKRFTDRIPHMRTCNFCNNDIFNRCYRCPLCVDDYDICLMCIAEGRGCTHNPSLQLMEHVGYSVLKKVLLDGMDAYQLLCTNLKATPQVNPFLSLLTKFSYLTNLGASARDPRSRKKDLRGLVGIFNGPALPPH